MDGIIKKMLITFVLLYRLLGKSIGTLIFVTMLLLHDFKSVFEYQHLFLPRHGL